jgi:hypothetical protein
LRVSCTTLADRGRMPLPQIISNEKIGFREY